MHSPRALPIGGRRAPIGMLGIFRAPYSASHPAGSSHGQHRPRQNRIAALAASVLLLTLYWAYLALQPAPKQMLPASGAAQQRRPGLPDWLEAQPDTNGGGDGGSSSGKSLHADSSQAVDGAAFAATISLNPELMGVLDGAWERARALQRMRRWEHGLGALQVRATREVRDMSHLSGHSARSIACKHTYTCHAFRCHVAQGLQTVTA